MKTSQLRRKIGVAMTVKERKAMELVIAILVIFVVCTVYLMGMR